MTESEPTVVKARPERRRFRRVRVDLPGRLFTPADGKEARCQICDLSPGGAAITCELMPAEGTQVVLYVDGFGRFAAKPEDHGTAGAMPDSGKGKRAVEAHLERGDLDASGAWPVAILQLGKKSIGGGHRPHGVGTGGTDPDLEDVENRKEHCTYLVAA